MVSPIAERDLDKKHHLYLLLKPGDQFLVHPCYVRKVDDVPLKPIAECFFVSRALVCTAVMFDYHT